jgi:hypothetical protein
VKHEDVESLGTLIDRLEANVMMLSNTALPAEMHVAALRKTLPNLVGELKEAFASVTGTNPWGD